MSAVVMHTASSEQRLVQTVSKLCEFLESRMERKQVYGILSETRQRPQNQKQTLKGLDNGTDRTL